MNGSSQRVALFVPCFVDTLWPSAGKAVVTLFERLGIAFDYPMLQTCCGQPAFNAGRWSEARALANRFAAVFGEYDRIIVPSGSCAAMCSRLYAYMDGVARAADVGARVRDLATFLVDDLGIVDVGARFPEKVTYLDGCHGRREMHATKAALALIRAVRELEYVELRGIDECCGFGGLFSVRYPALSVSMGEAKCSSVVASGAPVLVSGDASCLLHVGGMLQRDGAKIRTMHLAEILASA